MRGFGLFVAGLIVGAALMALAPFGPFRHPETVTATQDSAAIARAAAADARREAQPLVDSLARMHQRVDQLLARRPVVVPGPTNTTVEIVPPSGDTGRVVTVPPEVTAQLASDQEQIGSLILERDLAAQTVARLGLALEADSTAAALTSRAHALEVSDLHAQVHAAARSARLWKIGGAAVLVLVGAREVGQLLH